MVFESFVGSVLGTVLVNSLLQLVTCCERFISVLFWPFVVIVFRSALAADAVV